MRISLVFTQYGLGNLRPARLLADALQQSSVTFRTCPGSPDLLFMQMRARECPFFRLDSRCCDSKVHLQRAIKPARNPRLPCLAEYDARGTWRSGLRPAAAGLATAELATAEL